MPRWSKLYFRCNSFHYLGNWRIDVLMIAGMKSKCADNTEKVHQEVEVLRKLRNWKSLYLQIAPGLCSIIRVEDVEDPLVEAPEKVCEALVLFCQGQGLMPTLNRRGSRPSITFSQATDSSRSGIFAMGERVEWWLCWLHVVWKTYDGMFWQEDVDDWLRRARHTAVVSDSPGCRAHRRHVMAQRKEEERCIITLYYLTNLTNINHQVSFENNISQPESISSKPELQVFYTLYWDYGLLRKMIWTKLKN